MSHTKKTIIVNKRINMYTVINYKLQDDIIGRQKRRVDSRIKFEKQLLDTIMKGYFHYDFGDAIRTIVNPASEEEKDL